MWGGRPDRNMVSDEKGIPRTWDVDNKTNIKWVAELGSQSYGNPVVADGKIYVGTNNELLRNPKLGNDRGVVMCFRESDGEFLWQMTHAKLASGRVNDWPEQGVCSSPAVVDGVVYYVSSRAEVMAWMWKASGTAKTTVLIRTRKKRQRSTATLSGSSTCTKSWRCFPTTWPPRRR